MSKAPIKRIRERVAKENDYCNENSTPLLAPRWTRAGYEGRLKNAAIESNPDDDGYNADVGEMNAEEEKEVEVEETVLLTSNDQEDSDDEHLEMDDGFEES